MKRTTLLSIILASCAPKAPITATPTASIPSSHAQAPALEQKPLAKPATATPKTFSLKGIITPYRIIKPFVGQITGDGKYWILKDDLVYHYPPTNQEIRVPKGFVTDLASVPRLFWSVFPPCGKYTTAAVVHDYLYWEQPSWSSREGCDAILLKAMEESNVDLASREAIYRSVRAGGQSAWDKNRKDRNNGVIRQVPEGISYGPTDTWAEIESRIKSSRHPFRK